MINNPVAENVFGTLGAVFWAVQIIPQIWKTWREKSTQGLSTILVFGWSLSAPFMGVYCIVQNLNIPLIIQPQVFGTLCLVSWAQCLYYSRTPYRTRCAVLSFFVAAVTIGAFEVGMVYAVRPAVNKGDTGAVKVFGILSSVLISISLIPQYWEIYKMKEVQGISIPFMVVDMLGGVWSLLSLAFKSYFDAIAAASYSAVVVLDGLIILLALVLNPLAKRRRRRAAEALASITPRPQHDLGQSTPTTGEKSGDLPSPQSAITTDFEASSRKEGRSHTEEFEAEDGARGTGGDALLPTFMHS